jgi:hypothetical protein
MWWMDDAVDREEGSRLVLLPHACLTVKMDTSETVCLRNTNLQ